MSLVAMKTWRFGRSATLIASMGPLRVPVASARERGDGDAALRSRERLRWTASKSPSDAAGTGLDDVHPEARELPRDLELLPPR